jgi:outer membrane phospholipase A
MEVYIGYGELIFNWVSARSTRGYGQVELSARFRKGASEDLRRGAMYFEAAWNPNYGAPVEGIWRFTPYLFAQFFTGYAESLSTYDIMHTRLRVGFGLNDLLAISH